MTAYTRFTPNNSEQRSHPPYYRGCWHGVSRCFLRRYRQGYWVLTNNLFFPPDRALQPEGLLHPRGVAASGFPPLRNIPHCCLPWESGPCSSSSVADHPLRPANHRRLGRPLPYQLANGPQADLPAAASSRGHLLPQVPKNSWSYLVLAPLSVCYPKPECTLPTCHSPVRHFTHPEGLSRATCMC